MKWWKKHQKGSQEPKMLHPSLVTLSIHFFPGGVGGGVVCFSIHKMGKRLDEITANFPFGFDIHYSRIHQMDQSDLRDSGGVKLGPFTMTSALSPSLIPPGGYSSCSIRC